MTKIRRTVNFSTELDGILALLSSSSKQNLSEFLEYRLREIPEISTMLQKLRTAPEMQPMLKGSVPEPVRVKPESLKA